MKLKSALGWSEKGQSIRRRAMAKIASSALLAAISDEDAASSARSAAICMHVLDEQARQRAENASNY
jgi:DNA-binding TFAR19-related protein (PDSD5 family)